MNKLAADVVREMYAAVPDCRPASAQRWLEITVFSEGLTKALQAVFGKRLPSATLLGRKFTEWAGRHGDLALIGRESTHNKGLVWKVAPIAELAPKPAPAERAFPALTPRQEERLLEKLAKEVKDQAAPSLTLVMHSPPETLREPDTVTRDGRIIQGAVLTDRHGAPVKVHSLPPPTPKAPEPERKPATPECNPADARPPWLQRGELKPRNREEWQAWQAGRGTMRPTRQPVAGFADPGGVVSHNVEKEFAGAHVPRWSQGL